MSKEDNEFRIKNFMADFKEKSDMTKEEYKIFSKKMMEELVESASYEKLEKSSKDSALERHRLLLAEDIKDVNLCPRSIRNCLKCRCNLNDSVELYIGYRIQCDHCSRGIQTFTENWAILKWNNGIF